MIQKALILNEIGTPLVLTDRPVPVPGEDELLIKVTSAGLNPHDHRARDWGLFVANLPYIPAHDIAGKVLAVGPGDGAAQYKVGEHVYAQAKLTADQVFIDFYGLQEYALVDVRFAAKVADSGLTDDEAASTPVNVASLFVAMFHHTGFGLPVPGTEEAKRNDLSNEAILIIGAGSNCGRSGVEFAKMAGFGTIIAHAGPSNEAELKAMGATHFINRHADNALGLIRSIVGDNLLYAIDVVNWGPQQGLGIAALSNSKRGTLITLLPPDGEFDPSEIGPKEAGFERRMTFGKMAIIPEFAPEFWTRISRWLKEGSISPGRFKVMDGLDADKVNAALDSYRDGSGFKVHIRP